MKGHEKLVVGVITAVAVICWALTQDGCPVRFEPPSVSRFAILPVWRRARSLPFPRFPFRLFAKASFREFRVYSIVEYSIVVIVYHMYNIYIYIYYSYTV